MAESGPGFSYQQAYFGAWATQGLSVAAELGLADQLANGPRSADELAKSVGVNGDALGRLMRALASIGVFAQDEHGRFALTPLAELLRSDHPQSQRPFAIMMGGEFQQAWGELLHSVKTCEPGFEKRYGMPFFQFMDQHPDRHRIYDAAMEVVHGPETGPMLDAYDFSQFKAVVDVGGGNGSVLSAILERHPHIQGTVFDLAAVADRTRAAIEGSNLAGRLRVEGGSFFERVPPGADAYLLRHVIHDWEDSDAIAILSNCRRAMKPTSKLLMVEMIIPPGNEPGFGKWLDLMMLLVRGRERTREQYGELLKRAGLRLSRIVPTAAEVSVIEGVCDP